MAMDVWKCPADQHSIMVCAWSGLIVCMFSVWLQPQSVVPASTVVLERVDGCQSDVFYRMEPRILVRVCEVQGHMSNSGVSYALALGLVHGWWGPYHFVSLAHTLRVHHIA